jgi:hypothetical protein
MIPCQFMTDIEVTSYTIMLADSASVLSIPRLFDFPLTSTPLHAYRAILDILSQSKCHLTDSLVTSSPSPAPPRHPVPVKHNLKDSLVTDSPSLDP